MMISTFLATAALAAAASMAQEPNLLTLGPLPSVSWVRTTNDFAFADGTLVLKPRADAAANYELAIPWTPPDAFYPCYTASDEIRVSLRCRGGGALVMTFDYTFMDVPREARAVTRRVVPTAEWKDFDFVLPVPRQEIQGLRFSLSADRGGGPVEVAGFRIDEIAPKDPSGRTLRVGGTAITGIAAVGSSDRMRWMHTYRAARMLRYALRKNGGAYLPIRTVGSADEVGAGFVVIDAPGGGATGDWTGGASVVCRGGRIVVAGGVPLGPQYGVFKLLGKVGIEYLGDAVFSVAGTGDFALPEGEDTFLPRTKIRTSSSRDSVNAELRGLLPPQQLYNNYVCCCPPSRSAYLTGHSFGYIFSPEEFGKSHPEYFALQEDGTRMNANTRDVRHAQYCWTEEGLFEPVVRRLLEVADANPCTRFAILTPGDGGGTYCRCARCAAAGTPSDNYFRFANRVARRLAAERPGLKTWIWAYVNNPEGPVLDEPTSPDLKVGYCVYASRYWPSCTIFNAPENEKGFQALAGWRKAVPDLGLVMYPCQCGEVNNLWPALRATTDMARNFAEQKDGAFFNQRFGFTPTFANGRLNGRSFANLMMYVTERVEEDPSYDPVAGAKGFIRRFFGVSAEPLEKYFFRVNDEVIRRNWQQGCEQHLRGLVTPELAAECLPLLDEAEKRAKASGDAALLRRFLRWKLTFLWSYVSDVSRGRGNVPTADFPGWARRVAEFCAVARELGATHMGSGKPEKWFYENAFLTLTVPKSGDWTKSPEVDRILADPEGTLGGDFPNRQERTADGWTIPFDGLMGGDLFHSSKVARRPSSGVSTLFTYLDVDALPSGACTLAVHGNYDRKTEGGSLMEVEVNGRRVYAGSVEPVVNRKGLVIPLGADVLKKGRNDIVIRNVMPDREAAGDREGGDRFLAPRNYKWGWFWVDRIAVSFGG